MKQYEITKKDICNHYFHFTKASNLENILKNGLIPKKGSHAKHIEKTEKVFFVEGLDNLLILFDSWITVYKMVPFLPIAKIAYGPVSFLLRSKYFPTFFADSYFKKVKKSRVHKNRAYRAFDQLLEECILLHLDLEDKVDFKYDDVDEIKMRGYKKHQLIELGYSLEYSDMDSFLMDKWNMHTLSNVGVSAKKIKLCFVGESTKMKEILVFAIQNTKLNLGKTCPVLYDYLCSRSLL